MSAADLQSWLVARVATSLGIDPRKVDVRAPFDSFGLSSRDAVVLSGDLELLLGRSLSPTLIYEYPTITALAQHLVADDLPQPDANGATQRTNADHQIAIVGMACRFPGAESLSAFWGLLTAGRDSIREVPAERWNSFDVYHTDAGVPGKTVSRWGGFLDGIDTFDPFFFGISPGEAERMDPQQRLLLELAWECFDDAALTMPVLARSRTGVFVGISVNEYALLQHSRPKLINGHSGTGNALSIAANRISYFFDLRGPSMAIDTACSSSLMAVHQACHSLRAGECELAIAGGVNVVLSPAHSIAFTKAGVLARDGRCKVFDARADGYVRGEGGGLVALKALSRALADGDDIYAVIRGSAVRQDGRTNGLMAPSREAQEGVLRAAYRNAAVDPNRVQYVEAHGTGTLLGDAIEAHALGAVVSAQRPNGRCAVGSVKSNFGHLEAAAGIAGLIKVALSLQRRMLPPSLHFETPNPHIEFAELGLEVQQQLAPWPSTGESLLAGISSFGFGGTNLHAVLEAVPLRCAPAANALPGRYELLPISAHTSDALIALARAWHAQVMATDASVTLAELCGAAARRNSLDVRAAFVTRSLPELAEAIAAFAASDGHSCVIAGQVSPAHSQLAFVFSGQGGQWLGMGRELLSSEPVFRAALAECDREVRRHTNWSLLEQIDATDAAARFDEVDVVQPVLFAIQVALARLWQSWGIVPVAVVGHSMGEVAAAHIAGALTLEDAALVICARSRLLRRISGCGTMAVVALSAEDTAAALNGLGQKVTIAASNSPLSTVIAGDSSAVEAFRAEMEQRGVWCSLINVDVASHSPQTAPLGAELGTLLAGITPLPPKIPFVSTVTETTSEGLLDADYWTLNLTQPVCFTQAICDLLRAGNRGFVEIGPHPVLVNAVRQTALDNAVPVTVLPTIKREEPERQTMLHSLATLYVDGYTAAVTKAAPRVERRVVVPPYPWQRERYWIESASASQFTRAASPIRGTHALLGQALEVAGTSGLRIWQFDLDPDRAVFLRDHRVNGDIVVPAAAYIDMMLAAAAHAGLSDTHALDDIALPGPLVLSDRAARVVQVILTPEHDETWSWSLHSRSAEAGGNPAWTLHASALLHALTGTDRGSAVNRAAIDSLTNDDAERVSPDDIYETLARRGLDYGPAMRGLASVSRRNGEVLARVAIPDQQLHEIDGYHVHPALLDAALQALAAAAPLAAVRDVETFVPVGLRRVRFYDRPRATLWTHAVLLPSTNGGRELEADIRLFDLSGKTIAELTGLRLARITHEPRKTSLAPDLWRYEVQWRAAAWPSDKLSPSASKHWLLLADGLGVADALRAMLEDQGQQCTVLRRDGAAASDAMRAAVTAALEGAGAPVRGVVHLWSADGIGAPCSGAELDRAQASGCESLLHVVQSLVARSGSGALPRLWVATNGAQPVHADQLLSPAQAPAWGLGRTIAFELPELKCTLVDLDPAQETAAAAVGLLRVLCATDDEDLVALRGGRRLVARLATPTAKSACANTTEPVHADATYLITGGLGGLGFMVARWLVSAGARHLVLVGRGPPSEAARVAVEALRAVGAQIEIAAADVTSEAAVCVLLNEIRERMPPLRGVLHAAGVLDNAAIVNLDADRLAKVMAPKVRGAWNLHLATQFDQLDWFVLFSSAVTVLGSPGQGNYAAGNSFLDALAHQRRQAGLRATCINWGPWADIGLVADGFKQSATGGHGVKSIAPERGLAALDEAIRSGVTQVTLLPFDMFSLLELYPAAARIPFFSEVGGKDTHVSRLYARPALPQPYIAPRNDIERRLAELWRQTLRIDQVGVRDSFFELGGDSVLAAQIVTAAYRSFGVGIDLKEVFHSFTIEHLAQRLEAALIVTAKPQIPQRPAGTQAPLSFVQERQLFLELLDPHTAVNNLCMCVRIDGQLDVARLGASANALFARHDVLRTSFTVDGGRPVPQIAPQLTLDLNVIDAASPEGEPLTEALQLAEAVAREPFELDQPPLLRVRLYRAAPEVHLLLIAVHHTIADGWSLGVVIDELFTAYATLGRGGSVALPALQSHYGDFAAWQREALRGPRIEPDLRFWSTQLGGELPVLDLPTDHPRPARQTFAGATHHVHLSSAVAEQVKAVSRLHNATPFMTLISAFMALLQRFSGQVDLLVGTPTAGRTLPETEAMIGAFINTLVLRVNLGGDPTFAELLARVRTVALDAYAHQELPFEKLVAELRPERDLSRTPVFQVMFIMQNTPLRVLEISDLSLSLLPVDRGAAQFDLTLTVTERPAGLDASFEYNTDLFGAATIARLATAFELLLSEALARPTTPIAMLPIMTEAQRHRLVSDFNATAADYPRNTSIHELVAAQARRTPAAVAVVCDEARVSYADLDARANALAAQLQKLGVGKHDLVAVLVERSAELVIALLGVLKTGAAYLPLDPTTPAERVALVLGDAGTRMVLCEGVAVPAGVEEHLTVVRMSDLPTDGVPARAQPFAPRDVAYVIYTSGSTGQPKGVVVPHCAVVNLLCAMQERFALGAKDSLLAVTSVSFDIAALELFLPLITGATLVVATRDTTTHSGRLETALAQHQATIMQATPATWRLLLQGGWSGAAGLTVLCGGEPLAPALAAELLDRAACVWNLYGPTETTIWSSASRLERGRGVTIGRPIENTQFYVLDERCLPVPIGVTGELYIGGDGVALGYHGRPDLTAERFVADPFACDGARRMFRTGDRARALDDGNIELFGRLDDQVKIHGFRIELGEVEAALCRHPEVREAAVVARVGAAGGRTLAAYFVAAAEPPPEANTLRAFLRAVLPAYMVPAVFVPLPELPLTSSGKIDRRALPTAPPTPVSDDYVPPSNAQEALLAEAYAAVLALERVGINDNFFDLGGGSIQILEIIVHAQAAGMNLIPEQFFQHQTIAELASSLAGVTDDA